MNERIQELADQAMVTRGRMRVIDEGKFAELIVQECFRHFNEDYQRDFVDTLWREDLSKGMKEHFGVE